MSGLACTYIVSSLCRAEFTAKLNRYLKKKAHGAHTDASSSELCVRRKPERKRPRFWMSFCSSSDALPYAAWRSVVGDECVFFSLDLKSFTVFVLI